MKSRFGTLLTRSLKTDKTSGGDEICPRPLLDTAGHQPSCVKCSHPSYLLYHPD